LIWQTALYNQLRRSSLVVAGPDEGDVYGVPFMWGPDPMIYDTTAFPSLPKAGMLCGPEAEGKSFRVDDLSTVYMAAQVLGYDKPIPLIYII